MHVEQAEQAYHIQEAANRHRQVLCVMQTHSTSQEAAGHFGGVARKHVSLTSPLSLLEQCLGYYLPPFHDHLRGSALR